MNITLQEAQAAIDAAHRKAGDIKVRVTVAVVDDGGHLVALSRMDGASALSPELAEAKAVGAAVYGHPGGAIAEAYEKRPGFFAVASSLTRRPMVPGLGSVLVKRDDRLIGAIGVSGARPEQDLECAEAGLAAIVTR